MGERGSTKTSISSYSYNTQNYNDLGDGSMSKVILLAKFDGLDNTLGQEKAKTKTISNSFE